MLRRLASVTLLGLLVAGCGQAAEDDVLATVGGSPVRKDYVETLLPPSGNSVVQIAGEPHPIETALDLAIRDQLLFNEAERRNLPGDTRAEQLAALVAAERAAEPTLSAASITDSQAAAWYAGHRSLFDEVARARVRWAEFGDEASARVAYEGDATDGGPPAGQVSDAPARRSGVASIHHDGGADETVLRITNAVRRAGGIGLDRRPDNGAWYVVKVETISFERSQWTPPFAAKVRSAMAWEREEAHLQRLADRLALEWPVRIIDDRVSELIN